MDGDYETEIETEIMSEYENSRDDSGGSDNSDDSGDSDAEPQPEYNNTNANVGVSDQVGIQIPPRLNRQNATIGMTPANTPTTPKTEIPQPDGISSHAGTDTYKPIQFWFNQTPYAFINGTGRAFTDTKQ